MYHSFFIHSSVDVHLGGFHVLATVNSGNIERQISYDITCMWNLIKNDTNEFFLQNRNWLTDFKNKLWLSKVKHGGRDKLGDWD